MNHLALFSSFVAVVEHGSFTQAAQHLGKTKAIVSRQVSQLEAQLNSRLISRTTRALSITESGKEVYQRARAILEQVDDLSQYSQQQNEQLSGRLRLSAPQTFGELNLMKILPSFMQKHPQLKVELVLNDRYVDIVEEGFDLAIRIGQLDDSNLIARKIASYQQVLVASPKFVTKHQVTHFEQLSTLACIVDSNRRGGNKWQFTRQGSIHSVKVNPQLNVNSALAAAVAAEQGLGICLSPAFAVQQQLTNGSLVSLFDDYLNDGIGVYAIYPHRQYLTKKVSAFINHLQQHF
ncbi:LysR family transcriptional regulator [Agarivorans sp. Toyoura001]|uniref:LysR family transcriptional regulator n=1 Tax=Agarivorans sp. Toyoura001 TaxID=2283141 RepID=UPI0010E67EC4|nr:LysR family transcriptional regulator [Agarivorans sp. Toyoura001]GDY24462.1 LysR family transcriptional regulator [Agarivorans sp. Toyoura001]